MSERSPACAEASDREALLAMEPELRTLRGVLAALRIFAQSSDPVDPAAIAMLATSGGQALEGTLGLWRALLEQRPP